MYYICYSLDSKWWWIDLAVGPGLTYSFLSLFFRLWVMPCPYCQSGTYSFCCLLLVCEWWLVLTVGPGLTYSVLSLFFREWVVSCPCYWPRTYICTYFVPSLFFSLWVVSCPCVTLELTYSALSLFFSLYVVSYPSVGPGLTDSTLSLSFRLWVVPYPCCYSGIDIFCSSGCEYCLILTVSPGLTYFIYVLQQVSGVFSSLSFNFKLMNFLLFILLSVWVLYHKLQLLYFWQSWILLHQLTSEYGMSCTKNCPATNLFLFSRTKSLPS